VGASTRVVRVKTARGLLGILAVSFILCAFLYLFQDRIIFVRAPVVRGTPADVGLQYQPLRLAAADGTKLSGWSVSGLHGAPAPRAWVLFCHGKGVNIGDRSRFWWLSPNSVWEW
jgi:hypothetical protein